MNVLAGFSSRFTSRGCCVSPSVLRFWGSAARLEAVLCGAYVSLPDRLL